MVIVVIKCSIKPERTQEFRNFWKQKALVRNRRGLVGEFLSDVGSKRAYPYITWNLDDERTDPYKVYINVGIWSESDAFHQQNSQYFNDIVPMKKFEAARRVRTVLAAPIHERRL